jgi:hypothetical protein
MTTKLEKQAVSYLLEQFKHSRYKFAQKKDGDKGFDLWLIKKNKEKVKAEVKARTGKYTRLSNLFERLIFNADIEKKLFEKGESVIIRVFLGDTPPTVFIINNQILAEGAVLKAEPRYVLRGKVNYKGSCERIA